MIKICPQKLRVVGLKIHWPKMTLCSFVSLQHHNGFKMCRLSAFFKSKIIKPHNSNCISCHFNCFNVKIQHPAFSISVSGWVLWLWVTKSPSSQHYSNPHPSPPRQKILAGCFISQEETVFWCEAWLWAVLASFEIKSFSSRELNKITCCVTEMVQCTCCTQPKVRIWS